MRQAEAIKLRIEDLISARISGHAPSDATSHWLASLDDKMIKKLAKVGLAKQREVATLGAFTESYITSRVDIKPRTKINLNRARSYLLSYFDGNCKRNCLEKFNN